MYTMSIELGDPGANVHDKGFVEIVGPVTAKGHSGQHREDHLRSIEELHKYFELMFTWSEQKLDVRQRLAQACSSTLGTALK